MDKLCHFSTKMAITSPRKVQIPKFWCLKSSTNIWLSFGNLSSITKVKNIELEQKECSKLAKISQIFALKKLNLHFLKNFPRFDFTAFFCDLQCIRPIIIHWQSLWYRTGVVGGIHGWRETDLNIKGSLKWNSSIVFHFINFVVDLGAWQLLLDVSLMSHLLSGNGGEVAASGGETNDKVSARYNREGHQRILRHRAD